MSVPVMAVLLALLCASTVRAVPLYQRPTNGDCIQMGGSSDDVQLFPDQYRLVGDEQVVDDFTTEVTTAVGFTVTYHPTYKVVNNTIAGEVYVLYQCGASPPLEASFPEGTKFFKVPLTSLSAPETVPYAFVELLGLGDRVHDVSPFVVSPCGQTLLACPEGSRASPDFSVLSNATFLEETIGGSIDGMVTTSGGDFAKSFAFSAAQDPGALNRAEWIKYVGLFFNREREASQIFEGIKAEYEATKEAATSGAANKPQPVVAWAEYFEYPGFGQGYQLSFAPYKAQLVEDAGGAMLDREAIAAIQGVQTDDFGPTLSFSWGTDGAFETRDAARAAFLDVLKQADVIIDETYSPVPNNYTLDTLLQTWDMTAEEATDVPAFANEKVFREDGLLSYDPVTQVYGMDWFEGAIARPGQVLKDLVRALHPELAEQDQGFTWIRNLQTEQPAVLTAADCAAKSDCTAEPATICPFVKLCEEGQAPALLSSDAEGTCTYAECGQASALQPGGDAQAAPGPMLPTNAAAMAAPAVVLTIVVIAFVEMLMHFC